MSKVICIVGPTASGKSALAEELALRHKGQIISADSMQIYKGMDIGTAKVLEHERRVPYHCIDFLDPGQPYSAAVFQKDARQAIETIKTAGQTPILCGGTGLYIRAALDEMDFAEGDQTNNPVREHYTKLLEELGPEALHAQLADEDPESASLIHPNNTRRVIRAFEMMAVGESYAARKHAFKTVPESIPSIRIGLEVDTEILYDRINRRVDQMESAGLIQEVQSLLSQGFREGLCAQQAIGYKEIVSFLDGKITKDEALSQVKQATRRYAKRQRSWFKSDSRILWLNANDGITPKLIKQAEELIHEHANS